MGHTTIVTTTRSVYAEGYGTREEKGSPPQAGEAGNRPPAIAMLTARPQRCRVATAGEVAGR